MRTHSIKVADRVISYPFNDRAVSKNVGADQLSVEFDDEWKATTSALAVFAGSGKVVRVAMDASGGKATIAVPWEVLQDGGPLNVSFVGYFPGNKRIVTEGMSRPLLVAEGGEVDGGDAADPSPDVVQTELQAAAGATAAAKAAAKNANAAASNASGAAKSAGDEAAKAAESARKADDAAVGANDAANAASEAAGKASSAAEGAESSAAQADSAAKDAVKAAEEARGAVSADRKFYFKRVTDANGDTRPVIVDMTVNG